MSPWFSMLGPASLVVATAVSVVFALLAPGGSSGTGGGTTLGGARDVVALLEPLCPDSVEIEQPEDGEPAADVVEEPQEYAVCESDGGDDDELVEAFVVSSNPDYDIVNTADGWESGDGTGVTWAIKPDGEDWIAIVAVGDDFDYEAFEALQDDGFELHSNPSSPLDGYDDYYG